MMIYLHSCVVNLQYDDTIVGLSYYSICLYDHIINTTVMQLYNKCELMMLHAKYIHCWWKNLLYHANT